MSGVQNKTYLEHLQDVQIDQNIEKIKDGPGYIASYPYNSDLSKLLTNEDIAMKRAENVEMNVKKNPADLESINKEIKKSFDNGAFRFLTQEEIDDWDGQIHTRIATQLQSDAALMPPSLTEMDGL